MRTWYYHESGQRKGPIAEDDLLKLFEWGYLSASTFVWTKGLKEWREAGTIEDLLPTQFVPPPFHGAEAAVRARDFNPSGPQIRPWVRYWARTIDLVLFGILSGIVLGLTYHSALGMNDLIFGIILASLYVFVEPCMLSSWGTTPGKALLNVSLRKQDGSKLKYADALSRSFKVWMRGFGFGIPIVVLVTLITAHAELARAGITSWDKDGGFRVTHNIIGAGRIIAIIAILTLICILLGSREQGEVLY